MSKWIPRPGDGIVDCLGRRRIVDGIATGCTDDDFRGIIYTDASGNRRKLEPTEYRRETFREYLTRPTGFGRWAWWQFAIIALMSCYGLFIGISTWHDGGWFAVAFIAVLWAVIVWWHHRNYTGEAR
jgi:hypothetical protein